MYPRHRLDISVRDLLFGLSACLWAWRRRKLAADVALACPAEDDVVVCLSVRSGFGLLLGEIGGAPGDEVLVSAVTHPDMVRVLEESGMRAVPVDLEISSLAPRIEALEAEITPRTRAVVVAHLVAHPGRAPWSRTSSVAAWTSAPSPPSRGSMACS